MWSSLWQNPPGTVWKSIILHNTDDSSNSRHISASNGDFENKTKHTNKNEKEKKKEKKKEGPSKDLNKIWLKL